MVDISKKIKRDNYTKDHSEGLFHEIAITVIGILIDLTPIILISFSISLLSLNIITLNTFVILIIPLILLTLYFVYLIFIKFYKFKINEFKLKDKRINENTTIVFISDLHTGNGFYETNKFRLKRIINILNTLNYDLLIIGGDIFNFKPDINLITQLKDIKGSKLTVLGNHDHKFKFHNIKLNGFKSVDKLINEVIPVLHNEGKYLNNIHIIGIDDMWERDFNIKEINKKLIEKDFNILISHNPDIIDHIQLESPIDLILSGHLHSGQININKLSLPMPTRYQWLRRGLYKVGNRTKLLLSQGIGVSRSRLRINTDNEICVIRLIKG